MIQAAQDNLVGRQVDNVRFQVMSAESLHFPSERFDVVLNRHSTVHVGETVRVLKPGGYFIHQTVGHRNTANIDAAFGWTQASFGDEAWPTAAEMAQTFRQAGCQVRALAEYDVPYRFLDVESFIFWRKAVPWPEEFDPDKHWQAVNYILDIYQTARGIETNEHRELIIIQK